MSEEVKNALTILLNDLTNLGEEKINQSYTVGKAMASAKSGYDIQASLLDRDISLRSVTFNTEQLDQMLTKLDAEIMNINPAGFASTTEYMKEVERVFDKYAHRQQSWVFYLEQPYYDGFLQGSKEIKDRLAQEKNVPDSQMGFFWRTMGDERVCAICEALDGQWFPMDDVQITFTAHIGCRCPENFEYGVNPGYEGEGMLG